MCPRSSDQFYIVFLPYKTGHYFLDIQYKYLPRDAFHGCRNFKKCLGLICFNTFLKDSRNAFLYDQ